MDEIKKIKVFDSLLTDVEYKRVTEKVKQLKWTYGHTSSPLHGEKSTPFWNSNLMDDLYFSEYLFGIIRKTVNEPLVLDRVYCNGQTYGQNGTYHKDTDDPNGRTFILYINDLPDEDYDMADGYLYIKFPELDYNILYEPIKNRGIYFPGEYLHKANGFSRFTKSMRISLVWKTNIKESN